jgi:BirA family biotin operon repressor/biotin-[acetyl-CoA-carboxylase] ligase
VDSTNLELQRRWRAGQCHPQLLVAEEQTAGRGRLGRQWHSRSGSSLTFSLALPVPLQDWSGLSLVVGLAVAESLHPRVGLKWPNDLWVMDAPQQGRKLGGILVESVSAGAPSRMMPTAEAPKSSLLVIGIGLNVVEQDWEGVSVTPACVQELLPGVDAGQVLQRVVPALAQALTQFFANGFAPFQARFGARDVLAGGPLVLSDGRTGRSAGVDIDGAMLLDIGLERVRVVSGEVSVRPGQDESGSFVPTGSQGSAPDDPVAISR